MNNQENRLSRELAPEVFQIASELYAQEQQEYSVQDLILIGEEAKIPAEFIYKAVEIIQARQRQQKIQTQNKFKKFKFVLLGVAVTAVTLLVGGWAYNQLSPIQSNSETPGKILPGKNNKSHIGNVESYLLNKEGLIDGLLLNDGKQIKFASHMSEQLETAIQPGDTVEVVGKFGTPSNYGQEIDARLITNKQNNKTVARKPKPKGNKKLDAVGVNPLQIDDSVQHWLVNGKGEIRGAILISGTQVHLSKPLGKNLTQLAKSGSQVKADGVGKETPHGYVIEVISLKIDEQLLPNAK
ncbi:MAG: hypothetical protein MET45_14230 [Nostoc sp. LLA-1]|nr:hypothetical protein [Cyanocohniella sp. LLY]